MLRSLLPFRFCDDGVLGTLVEHSEMVLAPNDYVLFERNSDTGEVCFVVDGDIQLTDADGNCRIVSGGSVLSHLPLNPQVTCTEDAIVRDSAMVMRLDRGEIQRITGKLITDAYCEQWATHDVQLEEDVYLDIYRGLEAGTLEMPSMPGTGVRIARHLEDPAANSESIARIIQLDPALTARLIQVANSPAFKGRTQIENCQNAVTRMGLSTTRDLVIGFVLKGLFRSRSAAVQNRMEALWRHSTRVAAISYALASKVPGLDAGHAMLAGLMHDIGVIPILTSAEHYPALVEDPGLLDRVIARLRADCGAMLLGRWAFAQEFIDVALHAEDWHRDAGDRPDYADIVIIAQMHSYIGTPMMAEIPRIDKVPAFDKMALGEMSPSMSLRVMDEAEEEINAMQQVLQ